MNIKKDKKIKLDDVLAVFKAKMGLVSPTCDEVGVSRTTFYAWRREDKEFDEACKEIEERCIDFAESELFKQIRDGSTTATIFYLKTKGKGRGYVERQEVDFGDKEVEFKIGGVNED